ncbi:MAG TPA: Ppx/GppA phosphatase family protein [Thermodesulfobacteriota bacterium]|nr:Ppx/GppA phosphatase family protein [Thermodesulfobacteriota bacterium]
MPIASIDVGTNTFRILIGEVQDNGLKKLYIGREITRLGRGFTEEQRVITQEAMSMGLSALKKFRGIIEEYKVGKVRAVATSVVRESLNGNEFVDKVKREIGIEIEVIPGKEEARLTVDGVLKSVSVYSDYSVIFDIGGGSTEYIFVKEGNIIDLRSINLGIVHLTERFLKNEVPSDSDIGALSLGIDRILSRELSWIPKIHDDKLSLVGTAGTPTTFAAIELGLEKYDPDLVNGFVLKREGVLQIFRTLINLPLQERLKIKGLEKGREDIIIPGTLILLKTMERFSKDEVLVSDGGLLEGVAFSIDS